MVISSLVVETIPEYTEAVAAAIERPTVDESHDTANEISFWEGVLIVNLIYLNFEDDETIYPDGV